jgi:FkbM family methyltransferase
MNVPGPTGLHFCWLIDAWNPSREKYLRAWQDRGWRCILWHGGQLSESPVPGVELRNAYDLVQGSIIENAYAYEREHWSHAACADLFRYLVLLKLGGAYVDIDVLPGPDAKASLYSEEPRFGVPNPPVGDIPLEIRFIFANAEHELMRRLLTQAVSNVRDFLRRGGYSRGFGSVVERTGPGMALPVVEQYAQERGRPLQTFLLVATDDDTPDNNQEHHGPHRLRPARRPQTIRQRMQRAHKAAGPQHPTSPKHYRPDTHDEIIFRDVMQGEYGKGLVYRDARVLDIGAHIGGFSVLAAQSGARQVHAFEAGRENYKLLSKNCNGLPVKCHYAAVWRSDVHEDLIWQQSDDAQNTGGGAVARGWSDLSAVGLDQVITEHGPFDLVKLDCEGSEIPILLTSEKLRQIPVLVGEYHPGQHMGKVAADLFEHLRAQGYDLTVVPTTGGFGLFTARRRDA